MSKILLKLTKLDTRKILINPAFMLTVESNPDTVIILNGGRKILVKESMEEIYDMLGEN